MVFSVKVRPTPRASVFVLWGDLDFGSAVQLQDAADAVLAGPHSAMPVVIDCSDLAFCDSSGIGVMVRIHQRLSACGGVLRLATVPGSVARVLRLTGLDQAIAVFATAQEALATGDGKQKPAAQDAPSAARVTSQG
ncbi:STAS domain-containing protein [Streptomyces sp. NPDC087917]|uniref:STAS domain-containing protein n=1 Tax=Streptomyces sp. NPDC087917 TaxID=3155060 RepID=UPI00342DBF1C